MDLIESEMTKHITFLSSQMTQLYNQATSTVHEKRLSQLSSSKDIFNKTAPYYKQRLASCGYNENLTYLQQGENTENIENIRKNRKWNIIWFNPTYRKLLKTNIGK